jgi:hypothetical protein
MRYLLVLIALCGLLFGCIGNVNVRINDLQNAGDNLLAQVKVNDQRAPDSILSKREAAFGTPMGDITFNPPEPKMVGNMLEIELTKLMREKGIQTKKDFSCDLMEFAVSTKATPLYWDLLGRIRLVLKQNGKEYSMVGKQTERTYVWPSETLITKVVEESLGQIRTQLKQVTIE